MAHDTHIYEARGWGQREPILRQHHGEHPYEACDVRPCGDQSRYHHEIHGRHPCVAHGGVGDPARHVMDGDEGSTTVGEDMGKIRQLQDMDYFTKHDWQWEGDLLDILN